MNTFDRSPDLEPTQLAAGNAPPTPPHEDPLDDVYGSAPSSPALVARREEMLSDLPSRQRAIDNDAYREGLSSSKGQYVQEGFDEGYSLGANLGLSVGYILGILQGLDAAWKTQDAQEHRIVHKEYIAAQEQLAIQQLLGQQWVNEEGLWKWDVHGEEDDPTFREVAAQHPVLREWTDKVEAMAQKYGVDVKAVEKHHASTQADGS